MSDRRIQYDAHRFCIATKRQNRLPGPALRKQCAEPESSPGRMCGGSGIVEADETFIGTKTRNKKRRGYGHKNAVLSLVERGGSVRSVHVTDVTAKTLLPIVNENIAKEARVMTDDAAAYYKKLDRFASHETVNHSADEYMRGDVHTNTVEGYFSIFKRGMKGVYKHCSEKHLHRYLTEFDFRYNARSSLGVEDVERATKAVKGVKGKRLTYKQPHGATEAS